MNLARAWQRHEAWRIERCHKRGAAAELLGGALLLPASAFVIWRAVEPGTACGTHPLAVAGGVLLFALGWSSLGRAYWVRLVARGASDAGAEAG